MPTHINGRVAGAVLLALSVSVNVLQAQKIRALVTRSEQSGTLVGTKAMPIEARTPEGRATRLAFDAGLPTVLYYFSPTCAWCERNWANIEALAARADGRFRVVALTSAREMKAFAEDHQLSVELLEALPDEALQAYRFTATPHTVVIDAYGLVSHEWRGAFMNRIATQIEDLFGVALPGLSLPDSSGSSQ